MRFADSANLLRASRPSFFPSLFARNNNLVSNVPKDMLSQQVPPPPQPKQIQQVQTSNVIPEETVRTKRQDYDPIQRQSQEFLDRQPRIDDRNYLEPRSYYDEPRRRVPRRWTEAPLPTPHHRHHYRRRHLLERIFERPRWIPRRRRSTSKIAAYYYDAQPPTRHRRHPYYSYY